MNQQRNGSINLHLCPADPLRFPEAEFLLLCLGSVGLGVLAGKLLLLAGLIP